MNSPSKPAPVFIFLVAGALASALAGCGSATLATQPQVGDVRGYAQLSDAAPRRLVSGPARLLHVDTNDGAAVTLFSVTAPAGGTADCGNAAQPRTEIAGDMSDHLNLDVRSGQTVCVVGNGGHRMRRTEVAWHARQLAPSAGGTDSSAILVAGAR